MGVVLLAGDVETQIKCRTFRDVCIIEALLNAALAADSAVFTTSNVADMLYELEWMMAL